DALLDLRARLRAQVAVSGDFGEFAGASSTNKGEAEDVTARALEGSVIPMLRELASDGEVHTDIQSAAILALAKMGRNEMLPTFQSLATGQSRSIRGPKIIEESSALALGLLQHRTDAVRDFLIELAGNQDAKTRTRSFALYSLGLLRPDGAPAGTCAVEIDAMSALAVDSGVPGDVRLAAIASMGLTEDPAAVAVLLPWLRSERAGGRSLQDLDLSVVASALGRIGTVRLDDETADEVVDALRDQFKRRNRLTRSSAAIALGRKGMVSDTRHRAEIRSVLAQVARGDLRRVQRQDTQFAAISLGRLAADSLDKSGRKALSTLMRLLEDRHAGTRSFAALGLALGVKDGTEEHRAVAGERILFHLSRDRGGMERRGALVISLGLIREPRATPLLAGMLEDRGVDTALRGASAIALGLMGDKKALPLVRKAMAERHRQSLRVDTAIAAGLLQDRQAVRQLVTTLKDPKSSQFVLGSVAMALGAIGDVRAVEPLEALVKDREFPDLTRALATVALGQIGDRRLHPVLARFSEDINYRAHYDAMAEILSIL
ncbi:MAG: HEAT repeat domain-containing protein, partial [Planctomycetota bacterium]